jgi:NAD(P)-dependent dehydrogenase (short-subunit alcohol dehydrogenase family)
MSRLPGALRTPFPCSRPLEGLGIGVTGGGGHLGRALCVGLAEQGAFVVAMGRNAESLRATVEAAHAGGWAGDVVAVVGDVSRADDVARALDRIEKETGAVHGWVNNAYGGPGGLFFELERANVMASLASGVGDVLLVTQAVAERMKPQRGGSIVNVASMYGLVSPQPRAYRAHPQWHNPPAYGAAKAGVIQFTRYAACHLGPHGIRVNSISPGPFPRDEIRGDADFVAELAARVPLGRVGHAGEIVGPAAFLLSAAASFVTGHDLVVDGGWTAW